MGMFDDYIDDGLEEPRANDNNENIYKQLEKEKIRKLQIENEYKLRNLVEKDLIVSILGELSQSVRNNFVDQAKRNAYNWANQLSIPEKERDIEKLISDMYEDSINGFISDIERLTNEGVFDL